MKTKDKNMIPLLLSSIDKVGERSKFFYPIKLFLMVVLLVVLILTFFTERVFNKGGKNNFSLDKYVPQAHAWGAGGAAGSGAAAGGTACGSCGGGGCAGCAGCAGCGGCVSCACISCAVNNPPAGNVNVN